ncbi:unnamed protein product [Owenia fusiformis]|uniref:VWFA domain-containing protein n=1 Tax=Owenia fusiformis TaxID=6347 RepID=A0A8J1TB36_OWEFU|nr:unnamed protein product [Owenia fusiformis]
MANYMLVSSFLLCCLCLSGAVEFRRPESTDDVVIFGDETDCNKPLRCPRDLVFAIDISCFVSNRSKTLMRNFIRELTARLYISPGAYGTRVGLVTYSNSYYHKMYFEEAADNFELRNIIRYMDLNQPNMCFRRTDLLLNSIRLRYFNPHIGDRVVNKYANTIVLITSGATWPSSYSQQAIIEAQELTKMGAKILVVGFFEPEIPKSNVTTSPTTAAPINNTTQNDTNTTPPTSPSRSSDTTPAYPTTTGEVFRTGEQIRAMDEWEQLASNPFSKYRFFVEDLEKYVTFVNPVMKVMCDTYKSCTSDKIACAPKRLCCGCDYMFVEPGLDQTMMWPFLAVMLGKCLEEGCIRNPEGYCKVTRLPPVPPCLSAALLKHALVELTNLQLLQGYSYVGIAYRFFETDLDLDGFFGMFQAASNYKGANFAKMTEFQIKRGVSATFFNLKLPNNLRINNGVEALYIAMDIEKLLFEGMEEVIALSERHNDAELAGFMKKTILPGSIKARKEVAQYIAQYHLLGPDIGEYILNKILREKYPIGNVNLFGIPRKMKSSAKTNDVDNKTEL